MSLSSTHEEFPETGNMGIRSLLWRIFGVVCVGIGMINAFIPLLPTTVFLIVGVWAFGKGAPEWRDRLLRHERYGAPLRHWQDGGRISKRGKRMALMGLATSFVITSIWLGLGLVTAALGVGLLVLACWLWSRPEPRP